MQTEVLGRYGISRYNYKRLETKIGNSQQLAAVLCEIVSLIRGVLQNLIIVPMYCHEKTRYSRGRYRGFVVPFVAVSLIAQSALLF